MSIDRAARREAQAWYVRGDSPEPFDVAACPKKQTQHEKQVHLERMRPEYYGRSAQFISACLSRSFNNRVRRGQLGFVRWTGEAIGTSDITSFGELSNAYLQTLLIDMHDEFTAIRTFAIDDDKGLDSFQELRALEALNAYRNYLIGHAVQDLAYNVQEGYKTATSHTVKLLERMAPLAAEITDSQEHAVAVLTSSHKPLMRIASLPIDVVESYAVDNLMLGKPFLERTQRGTIDITPTVYGHLAQVQSEHAPTIGCPVLFGKDQTKQIWEWAVVSANKAGLLA